MHGLPEQSNTVSKCRSKVQPSGVSTKHTNHNRDQRHNKNTLCVALCGVWKCIKPCDYDSCCVPFGQRLLFKILLPLTYWQRTMFCTTWCLRMHQTTKCWLLLCANRARSSIRCWLPFVFAKHTMFRPRWCLSLYYARVSESCYVAFGCAHWRVKNALWIAHCGVRVIWTPTVLNAVVCPLGFVFP